jgi:hypothetical protein
LGDYTLFVGHNWSKAMYVGAEERGLVQRNCIYADDVTYLETLDSHGNLLIAKFGSLVWMIGQINLQVCDLIVD